MALKDMSEMISYTTIDNNSREFSFKLSIIYQLWQESALIVSWASKRHHKYSFRCPKSD